MIAWSGRFKNLLGLELEANFYLRTKRADRNFSGRGAFGFNFLELTEVHTDTPRTVLVQFSTNE